MLVPPNAVVLGMLCGILCAAAPAFADTVILNDGSSYVGQFLGASAGQIPFTDNQGVQYNFPEGDVQSMVFTPSADIVTLRDSKVYSGHYNGPAPLPFADAEGVQYRFPLKDVASLVLTHRAGPPGGLSAEAKVIPEGTEIAIRTDERIESKRSAPGEVFPVTIDQDIFDSSGAVAIPRGSPAEVLVREIKGGGAVHSPELVLDLFSVTAGGREYRVVTTDVDVSNRKGLGTNRRTAEFGGGGSALGALVGAVFGGGKGAAVGAGAGAGAGVLTQLFTRGKEIKIPPEALLTFRLDRTLVLRPNR